MDGIDEGDHFEDLVGNSMQARLLMPSTFGQDFCLKNGWGKIVEQEIQLRTAQAGESLDALRLAIGHKSLLYKLCIRKSKTQSSKTRSQAELLQISSKIKELAGRYQRARAALSDLGAPADTLAKFQALSDSDLKVNTDVIEENRVGQRNDKLPWIWRTGGGNESPWMNESEICSFTSQRCSNPEKFAGSIGFERKLDMTGGTKSWNW
jgi:hypothetical protein